MRSHKYAIRATALILTTLFLFACLPMSASAGMSGKIIGDLNSDGRIDTIDYLLLKRFVLGTYNPPVMDHDVADVNGDWEIDSLDYLLLKRYVLGTYRIPLSVPATNEPPRPKSPDPALEEMFEIINAKRRENGKNALVYRWDLQEAADIRAHEIVTCFSHTRPNGEPFHSVIYQFGVYGFCAEVLTEGEFGAGTAVELWMASEKGHRSILLFSTMTGMVVGHTTVGKMNYWVALFVEEPYCP